MNIRLLLLICQIYIHLFFVIGLFLLPLSLSIPAVIINQVIFVGFCGTVFYHRVVSHNNPVRPVIEKALILLSWLGCSGSLIAWAGTHRQHHRYSDTAKDPHCPIHHGKLRAYWWSSGTQSIVRYIPDLLRKPWYVFQHQHYFKVLITLHVLIGFIFSFEVYWTTLIAPAFLMWFTGSSINALGHSEKGPLNNFFFGLLHAGEGWHANHHNTPSDPSFGHRFDWGHQIYRLIQKKP